MPTLSGVILKGIASAIPAVSIPGRLYFATDTNNVYRDNGISWDEVLVMASGGGGGSGSAFSSLPTPPALSSFTPINQSGAVFTTQNNGGVIALTFPAQSGLEWGLETIAVPGSTPWSIAAFFKTSVLSVDSSVSGLYLFDGTKLLGIEFLVQDGNTALRVEQIANVTTDSSTVYEESSVNLNSGAALQTPTPSQCGAYVRWRNDGTTLWADTSLDGYNWSNFYSQAVGFWLTPTAYGFGGLFQTSGSVSMVTSLQGWFPTDSATL